MHCWRFVRGIHSHSFPSWRASNAEMFAFHDVIMRSGRDFLGLDSVYMLSATLLLSQLFSWMIESVMMMSSNGTIFRVTGALCGEFTSHLWIPSQRPVTQSFDVFFDLCLNKPLSKQSWGWWLRRHRVHYDITICLNSLRPSDAYMRQ